MEESSIEDDTPCDCCECQGSSDEEYSVDGRIPQLSVIGEEDEEAVSVFDPDNEEMEFHRKFMEKVYGRNPRASKVFNPGVIVESGSDSSENGETEEQEIEEFEGKKKPVFDIEAFLKYTGNVEDWLERIEDLGNIPGMLLVTMYHKLTKCCHKLHTECCEGMLSLLPQFRRFLLYLSNVMQ